jgi:serine/threonine-protein kinase
MAPEIVEGREADARSDLFSIGTILYWLATGKLPFLAANPTAILRRVLEGDYEDPRAADPRVPDALAELIVRCLAVDPDARPQSAAEVRDALDRLLADCGLERPAEEVLAFLRDPAAYRAAFVGRAVAALTARGDAALVEGASARALGFYARVLAIDPENAEVPDKLARLSRRRRAGRVALYGAIGLASAAVIATAAVLVAPHLRHAEARGEAVVSTSTATANPTVPPTPTPTSTSTHTPTPTAAETTTEEAAAEPVALDPDSANVEATPPTDTPSRTRHTASVARVTPGGTRRDAAPATLAVHVRPYAQRALLDGAEVARGEQLVRFTLTPGRTHVIQIEHACCAPYVREITAEEALKAGELRVPLEPRPARLRVEGDPATRVYVDGRFVGTAGDSQRAPFTVAVPAGDSPYEGPAKIGLEVAGVPPRDVQVKLRAGGEVIVAAPTSEAQP